MDGNWVFNVRNGQIDNGQRVGDYIAVEEESAPNLVLGNDETESPDLNYQASGNIRDNVSWGEDGFGAVTKVTVGTGVDADSFDVPADGSYTVYFDAFGQTGA